MEKSHSPIQVKGLIMEDAQGKEFVMVCDSPSMPMGQVFSLSGWQRRRLVPLRQTEREHQQIVTAVLLALNHLLENVPRVIG
jgi:hypothetical protein